MPAQKIALFFLVALIVIASWLWLTNLEGPANDDGSRSERIDIERERRDIETLSSDLAASSTPAPVFASTSSITPSPKPAEVSVSHIESLPPQPTTPPPPIINELQTGTYILEGYTSSSGNNPAYIGEVTIVQTGEVYKLEWRISSQVQSGVGILSDNILSVGYVDVTGESINDMGVVSYKLTSTGVLDGQWSSIASQQTGREILTWSHEY